MLCERARRVPGPKPLLPSGRDSSCMLAALVPARPAGQSEPHLELPEDAARVAVVVVSQGNVLQALAVRLQVVLHVLEEPGLVVVANAIQLK